MEVTFDGGQTSVNFAQVVFPTFTEGELPKFVPVAPPNAYEDCAQTDGHGARQENHLEPIDHVEGVHVDERPSEGGLCVMLDGSSEYMFYFVSLT